MLKGSRFLITMVATICFLSCLPGLSQENNESHLNVGADIFSNYIWRGTKFGTGPAFQPNIEYSGKILTAGAWSSVDFSGYQEADLYFSFLLPAGFTAGMTDYYYPGLKYFNYSETSGSHVFEANVGFSGGNFSLAANYILNKAGGAGSLGGDKYFEAKYAFKSFSLFAGAGDGWHVHNAVTGKNKFAVCNLGLEAVKKIKVTDLFSIPVTGQIILNPDKEQLYIVVGFTL